MSVCLIAPAPFRPVRLSRCTRHFRSEPSREGTRICRTQTSQVKRVEHGRSPVSTDSTSCRVGFMFTMRRWRVFGVAALPRSDIAVVAEATRILLKHLAFPRAAEVAGRHRIRPIAQWLAVPIRAAPVRQPDVAGSPEAAVASSVSGGAPRPTTTRCSGTTCRPLGGALAFTRSWCSRACAANRSAIRAAWFPAGILLATEAPQTLGGWRSTPPSRVRPGVCHHRVHR